MLGSEPAYKTLAAKVPAVVSPVAGMVTVLVVTAGVFAGMRNVELGNTCVAGAAKVGRAFPLSRL